MKDKEVFNIFSHILVPEHVIMAKEEVDELLKKYNITLGQLPKISVKDPAAKLLDAKPGDVIKITRKSETAGQSKYYRLVIGEE
jgi:DNA-directed RNA polymerase subunit H